MGTHRPTTCELRTKSIPDAAASSAALTLVQRSMAEVSVACARDSSLQCVQHSAGTEPAGCPFSIDSHAALLHSSAVEACIRMGYWWNRRYCRDAAPPEAPHVIDASTGAPMSLPVFPASRIATFTSRRWPYGVAATANLTVAIDPIDSVGPGAYPCRPVLAASRVSTFARGQGYNPTDADVILWAGLSMGFENLAAQSSAFFDDVPWAKKKNMIVWRGGPNGCWTLDGACPNRDLATPRVQSHASRVAAWWRLRGSELADVEFNRRPGAFELAGNAYARVRLDLGVRQLTHFFPERFNKMNATAYMRDTYGLLANASRQLCHVEPCPRGTKPAQMSPAAQSAYKIILQIDGESFASCAAWTQLTSSVVMAPSSAYSTYADVGMLPWKHFIPTAMDFSDAEQNARWCFANDRECKAIGAAGRAHMLRLYAESPAQPPAAAEAVLQPSKRSTAQHDILRRKLDISSFEKEVDEIVVAHLVANARQC